jgi:hypothetical protein
MTHQHVMDIIVWSGFTLACCAFSAAVFVCRSLSETLGRVISVCEKQDALIHDLISRLTRLLPDPRAKEDGHERAH